MQVHKMFEIKKLQSIVARLATERSTTYASVDGLECEGKTSIDYDEAAVKWSTGQDIAFSDHSTTVSSPSAHHRSSWYLRIFLAINLFCTLLLLWSSSSTAHEKHHVPSGREFGDCGTTGNVSEARAKGCVFDPASLIWVQPACYDAELVADFFARTNYSFYTNGTLLPEYEIPLSDWVKGDYPIVFAPRQYHLIHCYYMWEKLHKAYLTGGPIDSEVAQLHHTRHCSKSLLNDYLGEDICPPGSRCPTYAGTVWTSCGYYH